MAVESASGLPAVFLAIQQIHTTAPVSCEPTSRQFSVVHIIVAWCPSAEDSRHLPAMLGSYFMRRIMILNATMHLKYRGKAVPKSSGCFRYRFEDNTISLGTVPATRNAIPQLAQSSKEAQAAFPHCPKHCFRRAETVSMQGCALPSAPLLLLEP